MAGGIGAGKFLRGLVRVVDPRRVTVVVNTGDDIELHGMHVSPDLDSVMYWLGGVMDRERGWGRAGETFRATEEMARLGAEGAWFGLGDLDLATHLIRTTALRAGSGLAAATADLCRRFGIASRILPMTEDAVTTRVRVRAGGGDTFDLHFQDYWVRRGAQDDVVAVSYEGAAAASPAEGVLDAIAAADVVVLCPSNPIASIDPILAVPGIRGAVRARAPAVVGISPIVGGAPLRGMADRLLPAAGVEVSAAGVGGRYRDLLGAWVIDERDRDLLPRIEALGIRAVVTDTIMRDDAASERLARTALSTVLASAT